VYPLLKKALLRSAFFIAWLFALPTEGWAETRLCPDLRIAGQGQVQQIYDGDTIELNDGRKVRLLGINTPEIDHQQGHSEPFAIQARDRLKQLVPPGTSVRLQTDVEKTDRYGRVLAHLLLPDGSNPAVVLLQEGLATLLILPPNIAAANCFAAYERGARKRSMGIWNHSRYQPMAVTLLAHGKPRTGYQVLEGRITQVAASRKFHYFIVGNRLSVRVSKRDWTDYFGHPFAPTWPGAIPPQQLLGGQVTIRGWLRAGRPERKLHYALPQMRLYHPAGLEWMP